MMLHKNIHFFNGSITLNIGLDERDLSPNKTAFILLEAKRPAKKSYSCSRITKV